jgi:signal transduction histidine kinase
VTERVHRYNLGRFVVSLSVLGTTVVGVLRGGDLDADGLRILEFSAVQLLLLVASAAWTLVQPVGPTFLYAMFAADVLGASVLSAWTGGPSSLLVFLYFPVIAAGAYLLGQTGANVVAGLSAVGLIGVALLSPGSADDPLLAYWESGSRVLSLILVGVLSGQLAESLAAAGRQLQVQKVASETVLERVRAGVLTVDLTDHVVEVNPSGRLLLGDIEGRRLTDVFRGAMHHRAWEEVLGERRLVCSQAVLPDQGRVVVVEDVTELWAMRERAQRDERLVSVGQLAAGLAHEIRNPLASLSAVLQMLQEDHPSRQLELALGEAERLNRLVEDFLSASRRPSLSQVPLDLDDLVRDAVDAFAQDPRFVGTVSMRVASDTAPAFVDPDRMRQVVWNLLTNAAQASPPGGELRVDVGAGPDGGAEIVVSDDGTGIPADELPRIFDPFYTRRAGGTGLGLAVVDQIVRSHGGHIDVTSAPGAGTRFTIHLPAPRV